MNNNRKWIKQNYDPDFEILESENRNPVLSDESAVLTFKELVFRLISEDINVVSTSILRKVLIFKGLSCEKYYSKIKELVLESENDKQVEKGIIKIAKEIVEEISRQ
jgi:hypothetical protein